MSEPPFAISIAEMYGDPGLDDAAIAAILAHSLDPRPSMRPCAQARRRHTQRANVCNRIVGAERSRVPLSRALGRTVYKNELANCHWGIYRVLGKLSPQCLT